MKTAKMIAIADGRLGTREFTSGEWLDVTPIEAASLKYRRVARFATAAEVQQRAVIEAAEVQKTVTAQRPIINRSASPGRRSRSTDGSAAIKGSRKNKSTVPA